MGLGWFEGFWVSDGGSGEIEQEGKQVNEREGGEKSKRE